MNTEQNGEMKELREESPEYAGYRRNESIRRRRTFGDFRSDKKILILAGVFLLVLIILISVFSGGGNEELTSLQGRLEQLDRRIEAMERRIVFLEDQQKEAQGTIGAMDTAGGPSTQILNKLTQRVGRLEKRMSSLTAKRGPLADTQRKQGPVVKKRYHEVQPGETLYRIARQHGISVDELCRLNRITPEQFIHLGQKLVVSPSSHQ